MKKLKDLPVGALVKDIGTTYRNSPIIWRVVAKNHPGYPASSVTLFSHRLLCVKCFDAKEPRNPNQSQRKNGNSSYRLSNISQWLNSDKSSWYSPQHQYDAPPKKENLFGEISYDYEAGFMHYFSSNFKNALLTTNVKCTGNSLEGGSDSVKTIYQKLFLPSMAEVGVAINSNVGYHAVYQLEGKPLPFFNGDESRKMYLTREAVVYDQRPGWSSLPSNEPYYWTLRTARYNSDYGIFFIHPLGLLNTYGLNDASQSFGICPMCNIGEYINVSNNFGSDGAYTIVWNNAPSISLNGASNIGEQQSEFTKTYSITDADNDTVTVTEKLDNKVKKTETVTLGQQRAIEITRDEWLRLTNGNHKLIIEATDSKGAKSTAEYTFTKRENKVVVNLRMKADCDERPTRILVTPTWQKEGAIVKVEACNNMNDETPMWEDITERTLINKPSFLSNETKMAEKWKIGIKVTMKKNEGYNQEVSLSSIGGAYE